MAGPDRIDGYLAQIRWAVVSGAHYDMEDFSGRTQRGIAEAVADPGRKRLILEALEFNNSKIVFHRAKDAAIKKRSK